MNWGRIVYEKPGLVRVDGLFVFLFKVRATEEGTVVLTPDLRPLGRLVKAWLRHPVQITRRMAAA